MKKYAIVVLERGFVYVGHLDTDPITKLNLLSDAKNIRKWGTDKGLGQLVVNGPTKNTMLDPCGTVLIPDRSIISIHPTDEKLWK